MSGRTDTMEEWDMDMDMVTVMVLAIGLKESGTIHAKYKAGSYILQYRDRVQEELCRPGAILCGQAGGV
jgi:hypothetical protein